MFRPLLATLLLSASASAQAALEFSGYLKSPESVRFILTDTDTGATSDPLTIGGVFQGHTVKEFDSKKDTIVVEREGKTFQLPLKEARVQHGTAKPAASVEMKISISSEGVATIDEKPVALDKFEAMLKSHASSATATTILLHPPRDYGKKVQETIDKMMVAGRNSGHKDLALLVIDAPKSGPAKTTPSPANSP